jgi:Fe-S cluster assembly ATP-binding protein
LEKALGVELDLPESFKEKRLFREFSGGEAKFVDFLIALSLKPKVMLIDELDSQLDSEKIEVACKLLANYFKERGGIFILSTHVGKVLDLLPIKEVFKIKDGRVERKNP